MAENWTYTLIDTENEKQKFDKDLKYGIDLLEYFGFTSGKSIKKLKYCAGTDLVNMRNGKKKLLKDISFSEAPLLYHNNLVSADYLLRATAENHYLSVYEKHIWINPEFILVFIDGKYSKNWECVNSVLLINPDSLPEKSIEIYLLQNFDYNLQDSTYVYKSETEIGFTFNNLRLNQFIEHHLNSTERFIVDEGGIKNFIKHEEISYQCLLKFSATEMKNHAKITIRNVVQNQSETYEDVIVRKKLCEQDSKWSKDFSLWAGIEDIYGTSNSSSTLLFDQYGQLIDPISIDWFNKRLAPFSSWDIVEIQHPKDKVYTGEIYFPSVEHDADEHILRDPLNQYRYKHLYETNYKLVQLDSGKTYEYDTYFRKTFETLHLEETAYIKDYPSVKKGENLLLSDMLLNNVYQNDVSLDEDAHILNKITALQIQSDTGFIRREFITNGSDQLKFEIPKSSDIMMVFVDGRKQADTSYSISESEGKTYIELDNSYADEKEHILNIFYPKVYVNTIDGKRQEQISHFSLKLDKNDTKLPEFIDFLKKRVRDLYSGYCFNSNIVKKYFNFVAYCHPYFTLEGLNSLNPLCYNKLKENSLLSLISLFGLNESSSQPSDCNKCSLLGNEHANNCAYAQLFAIELIKEINVTGYKPDLNGFLMLFKFNEDLYSTYVDDLGINPSSNQTESDGFTRKLLLDCINVVLKFPGLKSEIILPLSFLLDCPIFSDFVLDVFSFDINDAFIQSGYFSISECNFNSSNQGFALNNLRKNIYMEHYDNVTVFHKLKCNDIHLGGLHYNLTFNNIADFYSSVINSTLVKMCEFRGVINCFDTVDNNLYYGSMPVRNFINDSLQGKFELMFDHREWVFDTESLTVSLTFRFELNEDLLKVYCNDVLTLTLNNVITDFNNPENFKVYIENDALETDEYGSVLYPSNSIDNFTFNNSDGYVLRISYPVDSIDDGYELVSQLMTKYIYIRETDIDLSTIYDSYKNNVYKLEQEMNRYSTLMFDKKGYLISPDSIDWVFTEFNYPMEDNQISILPLNSNYPAIIGEVYENSLERRQIMDLCLDDVIQIDGIMQSIENNTNYSFVPVDYDLSNTQQWLFLSNNDYVYWIEEAEEEDLMKFIVNVDDYIENNIFCFVNGYKVFDDDFEMLKERHMYRIHNFSKYDVPRYRTREYSKLTDTDHMLYIDSDNKYSFTETNTVVTVEDDSLFANAVFTDAMDILDSTRVVALCDNGREIVCYNYNPEDIEYVEKGYKSTYDFPGYYDYDLRRYALVFVNGLRYKNYQIENEKMMLNVEPDSNVEIYVFKKYDYNWTDEVRYRQYIDNRYFTTHNMKSLRIL